MKNNGKSDYSTHFVDKALTYINKHTDLNQPEQVKAFIANLPNVTNGYRKNLEYVTEMDGRKPFKKTQITPLFSSVLYRSISALN